MRLTLKRESSSEKNQSWLHRANFVSAALKADARARLICMDLKLQNRVTGSRGSPGGGGGLSVSRVPELPHYSVIFA